MLLTLLVALICLLVDVDTVTNISPCTDLQPLHLLRYLVTDSRHLPAGLDVVYDSTASVHTFRFAAQTGNSVSFPATAMLKQDGGRATSCYYFPEEFSLLMTFKMTSERKDNDKQQTQQTQCIMAVTSRGTTETKIAVQLHNKRLQVVYPRGRSRQNQLIEFKAVPAIFDTGWHTVIVTVTSDRVTSRTNCKKRKQRRMRRAFPSLIDIRHDDVHVGSCHSNGRGRFMVGGLYSNETGSLKELILLAGADIATRVCQTTTTTTTMDSTYFQVSGASGTQLHHITQQQQQQCLWSDTTGSQLHYNVNKQTLQVCLSGIWQTILQQQQQQQQQQARQLIGRMDYVTWYQDLVTSSPTSDMEVFRVSGEGLFLVTVNCDWKQPAVKQQSTVFKWTKQHFTVYQSLYILGAHSATYFNINKLCFLAIATKAPTKHRPSKSIVYLWSRHQHRFEVYQELVTWSARDIEYFSVDGRHFIVVANHNGALNSTAQSLVYEWQAEPVQGQGHHEGQGYNKGRQGQFVAVQYIDSAEAQDWTHFTLNGYHFLTVACSSSTLPPILPSTISTPLSQHVTIYFWQSGRFMPFQTLQVGGVVDIEFLSVAGDYYLALAVMYKTTTTTTTTTDQFTANSTIYRLDPHRKQFDIYQHIITHSAMDWESFIVGSDVFLIAAESMHSSTPQAQYNIYRWKGLDKFSIVNQLYVPQPATDWETFTADKHTFLVYANGLGSVSQVYKIQLV